MFGIQHFDPIDDGYVIYIITSELKLAYETEGRKYITYPVLLPHRIKKELNKMGLHVFLNPFALKHHTIVRI